MTGVAGAAVDGAVPDGAAPLLSVRDLHVSAHGRHGVLELVRGVSFDVGARERVAILGESGSGKTLTAHAVMGLLEAPAVHVSGGSVEFTGRELVGMPERQRREIRGRDMGMVFQDALSALNPVFTVGFQIAEMFRKRDGLNRSASKARAIELLDRVEIADAPRRVRAFPHELSGGMRQRVVIAMAIALRPKLLIADEPTTALDVTVQRQILELLGRLCAEDGMGLTLVTHDLGLVAEFADRAVVMYGGRVVETCTAAELFEGPAHPYSQALLASVPSLNDRQGGLRTIPGAPPDPRDIGTGCSFAPRCAHVQDRCRVAVPPMVELGDGRRSACIIAEELVCRG